MKILAISDLHTLYRTFDTSNWNADMIICAGDMTNGKETQIIDFLEWLSSLKIKHKIIVAGNHDWYFQEIGYESAFRLCNKYNIIYLENTSCTIEGINFFGSPYSNMFHNWAFMSSEKDLSKIYSKIPDNTNVIISHGPPKGILDCTYNTLNVGSSSLINKIKKLKELKIVIFGHIHEDRGHVNKNNIDFYNVSNYNYYEYYLEKELKAPTVIEIKTKFE
jgi:Icc-related predicted phosphoesterase